jgi:hypothetical protein
MAFYEQVVLLFLDWKDLIEKKEKTLAMEM